MPDFPYDTGSDRILAAAAQLDPADQSDHARYLRAAAEQVTDHRAARQAEHAGKP